MATPPPPPKRVTRSNSTSTLLTRAAEAGASSTSASTSASASTSTSTPAPPSTPLGRFTRSKTKNKSVEKLKDTIKDKVRGVGQSLKGVMNKGLKATPAKPKRNSSPKPSPARKATPKPLGRATRWTEANAHYQEVMPGTFAVAAGSGSSEPAGPSTSAAARAHDQDVEMDGRGPTEEDLLRDAVQHIAITRLTAGLATGTTPGLTSAGSSVVTSGALTPLTPVDGPKADSLPALGGKATTTSSSSGAENTSDKGKRRKRSSCGQIPSPKRARSASSSPPRVESTEGSAAVPAGATIPRIMLRIPARSLPASSSPARSPEPVTDKGKGKAVANSQPASPVDAPSSIEQAPLSFVEDSLAPLPAIQQPGAALVSEPEAAPTSISMTSELASLLALANAAESVSAPASGTAALPPASPANKRKREDNDAEPAKKRAVSPKPARATSPSANPAEPKRARTPPPRPPRNPRRGPAKRLSPKVQLPPADADTEQPAGSSEGVAGPAAAAGPWTQIPQFPEHPQPPATAETPASTEMPSHYSHKKLDVIQVPVRPRRELEAADALMVLCGEPLPLVPVYEPAEPVAAEAAPAFRNENRGTRGEDVTHLQALGYIARVDAGETPPIRLAPGRVAEPGMAGLIACGLRPWDIEGEIARHDAGRTPETRAALLGSAGRDAAEVLTTLRVGAAPPTRPTEHFAPASPSLWRHLPENVPYPLSDRAGESSCGLNGPDRGAGAPPGTEHPGPRMILPPPEEGVNFFAKQDRMTKYRYPVGKGDK